MNSFKSCRFIEDKQRPTRKSRRVSKMQPFKDEPLIANPFRHNDQENFLPSDLKNQVAQLDYLSPTQIQSIQFTTASGARRSSLFAKHLQAMQMAAKKQEQMYDCFLVGPPSQEPSHDDSMQEEQPMTIEQDENLSTRMNCFMMLDDDHMQAEHLTFLDPPQEEDVIFYSQDQIPAPCDEDFQAYFD